MILRTCIFSKDRACQLDLLLNSIEKFFENYKDESFTIIYKASNDEFNHGYELVKQKHPLFCFVKETNFKEDVKNIFKQHSHTVMFLVDDDMFIDRFSVTGPHFNKFVGNPTSLTLSLRMHPKVTYCYTTKTHTSPPMLLGNTWDWQTAPRNTDWSYPMSVDGHVFRYADVNQLFFGLNYNNPNSFEGALAGYAASYSKMKARMMCYSKPIIINNPVNKVQTLNGNHCGLTHSYPAADLNRDFLAGNSINLEATLKNLREFNAPHAEFPYVLTA